MRQRTRALVELTSWFTQHLWEFFESVHAGEEFGERLVELRGNDIDPTFGAATLYRLRIFPEVLSSEPRGILPPGYNPPLPKEPRVKYTFAIWSHVDPSLASDAAALRFMRRDVIPDLYGASSDGVARRRLARLAELLDQRIPGHRFQHFATVPSGGDLVSVFVDLESLERVAGVID